LARLLEEISMAPSEREPNWRLDRSGMKADTASPNEFDDSVGHQAALSAVLVSIFRGKLCDLILPNRKWVAFAPDEVIYEVGDEERTFFFLQSGFVKVGALTADGREVIYDIRKGGDVVGELCASGHSRPDRAVALERTEAIPVSFEETMALLLKRPEL